MAIDIATTEQKVNNELHLKESLKVLDQGNRIEDKKELKNNRKEKSIEKDSITECCAESLYNCSFTPITRVNKASKIKQHILSRGMDYMQRIRYTTRERDTVRRFSQPDIGILDSNEDWIISDKVKLGPSNSTCTSLLDQKHPGPDLFDISRKDNFHHLSPIHEAPTPPLSCAAQYKRALYAPSRFLPQNQSIITTDSNSTILLFNSNSTLCFGIDKSSIGQSILNELEEPFKSQISHILKNRQNIYNKNDKKGLVLVSGIVVPIRKIKGETISAASLWLKEKWTNEGNLIYIWIFEEIYETSMSINLNDKGNVIQVVGTIKELFGYEPNEMINNSISKIIPALSSNHDDIKEKVDKFKFYGGKGKSGIYFPTMINSSTSSPNTLKIVSLPSIAGLITMDEMGLIQSINPVPSKYLFGYSPEQLIDKVKIDQIIPQFSILLNNLQSCKLLKNQTTINPLLCRWALSDLFNPNHDLSNSFFSSLENQLSLSDENENLPILYAVHRDQSQFEIQLQLRLIQSEKENLISIWVTYDRIHARTQPKQKKDVEPDKISVTPSSFSHPTLVEKQTVIDPSSPPSSPIPIPSSNTIEEEDESLSFAAKKKRPIIRPYGISSFGSVDQKKALFPGGMKDNRSKPEESLTTTPYHPMDDYIIVGTLGEGAYGTAKLAYRKDDPTMTKVVIKFIAKSRIIVDSWIRDRQLGLIPLEIHILKKLKENPQVNCCALERYMEDEDRYYVVMKLYGTNSMDLFDYIELNEHIPEQEIRKIFKQVALAVNHIQSLSIVHRDIKDENILLDDTGCVQLIDFGSAAYFRKGRTFDTFGGTLDYCAPEILKGMPYEGPAQDIWSLGTLLYTLIYRENPFYNVDEIMEHDLRIPFIMSEGSLDLIRKMLNRDVEKRYTIQQVLVHPWLNTTVNN